jgi:hypothetical protein
LHTFWFFDTGRRSIATWGVGLGADTGAWGEFFASFRFGHNDLLLREPEQESAGMLNAEFVFHSSFIIPNWPRW